MYVKTQNMLEKCGYFLAQREREKESKKGGNSTGLLSAY